MNPVVGIHHKAVEELVARFGEEKPDRYVSPTITRPIGYLLPERAFRQWLLSETATDAAREMVDAVVQYGLPYMRTYSSLEALRRLLESGDAGPDHKVALRLPVVWLLLGDPQRGLSIAEQQLEARGASNDIWTQHYRAFVANLRGEIAGRDSTDAAE